MISGYGPTFKMKKKLELHLTYTDWSPDSTRNTKHFPHTQFHEHHLVHTTTIATRLVVAKSKLNDHVSHHGS